MIQRYLFTKEERKGFHLWDGECVSVAATEYLDPS